jgi:hypothetical protein
MVTCVSGKPLQDIFRKLGDHSGNLTKSLEASFFGSFGFSGSEALVFIPAMITSLVRVIRREKVL